MTTKSEPAKMDETITNNKAPAELKKGELTVSELDAAVGGDMTEYAIEPRPEPNLILKVCVAVISSLL
jgi:hypothetical protein